MDLWEIDEVFESHVIKERRRKNCEKEKEARINK